jgi:hypothetical protein
MKNLPIVLLLLLCGVNLSAQQKMNCCAPSATEAFSQFSSDKKFVRAY